jgi:hypothetical protein
MLDVHAPHETVHTWRDFFIHIATIVVGLIIAVGLEQTVELIHHRRELREAREEMQADIDVDRRITATDLQSIHLLQANLNRDMALLLAHRATSQPLTAKLNFDSTLFAMRNAAWKANQPSGVFNLMPHSEIEHDDFVFSGCDAIIRLRPAMEPRDRNRQSHRRSLTRRPALSQRH